jgi:hypothetical protein
VSEAQTIKAIPTVYRGIVFRSRNEAKHAGFFDELDIDWVYEPEGWELHDPTGGQTIRYIPDFYLTNDQMYVEVKRDWKTMSDEECARAERKCDLLAEASGCPVILAYGLPTHIAHWVTRGKCWLHDDLQYGGCRCCELTAEACDQTYSLQVAVFTPGSVYTDLLDRFEVIEEEDKVLILEAVDVALAYDFSSVPFDPGITWRSS